MKILLMGCLAGVMGCLVAAHEMDQCDASVDSCRHQKESEGGFRWIPSGQVAYEALMSTLLVTFGGNAVILLFIGMDVPKAVLNIMLAFAVGGLLGDVFLHLLPHAMDAQIHHHHHHHHEHEHRQDHIVDDHHHDHHQHEHGTEEYEHMHDNSVGLGVLAGILTFFFMEKFLRVVGGGGHGHSHSGKEKPKLGGSFFGLKPGAILNMAADTVHNFTDGMALAAAFQASPKLGMTMTAAVLVHEIPHEVGDYAVLLSQGLSKWGALQAQFVSAIGALLGCWFGLVVSSQEPVGVLAFTAGGFIYISAVSIIPEILQEEATLWNTIAQCLSFSAGIALMILIAEFEPPHLDH